MATRLLAGLMVLIIGGWASAQGVTAASDEEQSLPKYLTEAERQIPLPAAPEGPPPTGFVYCPAEYEPCEGLFIAWEGYTTILTELAVAVTTGDPQAKVFVVVDNTSEQSTVYSTLSSAGAVMSRVEFIVRPTDTVWIRDYGPRFIYENGDWAIIDHNYNRPRPLDNAFNDYLAVYWNIPQYDIPLTHGGGNFHLFSNGDAFMTDLILNENPGMSAQQVKDLYRAFQNVDLTIYPGFPSSFDATQHIDMWMLPVGDYKVIIGQYASSTGQPYTITEAAVSDLLFRGYTVYRTPGWRSGGTHYTYTNAVILNNQVFMPVFGGSYTSQDAQALAVFQQALPGYNIRPINCASIIGAAGALHCIVMHVPKASSHIVGDVNCDFQVNLADINPFVQLLTNPTGWQEANPKCRKLNGDINGDGRVDFLDINPFVRLLTQP